MDKKTFALAIIIILTFASVASAFSYASWIARAFKVGDVKWIDLNGQGIGNGSIQDVICISGCSNFNSTTISTETNASNLTSGTVSNSRLTASASNFNQTHSYNIYQDLSTTYMRNGSTGNVDFSDTGINRNYTVIQAAINNISNNGGKIIISKGTYIIDNTTIFIPLAAGRSIILQGEGQGATRLQAKTVLQTMNILNISATGQPTTIQDLSIFSATGGSFGVDGINISAGNSIILKNLWISGFRHGISLDYCSDCTLDSITSELSQQNFYINGSNGVKANSIYSYHASVDGMKIIDDASSGVVGGTSVTNSEFTENAGNGIYLLGANSTSITNSIFHNDGTAPTAIYVENGYSTLISANSFKSFTGRGIGFVATNEVAIVGNSFQYVPVGVDALSGTISNVSITANVFRGVATKYQGTMSPLRVVANPSVPDV